MSILVVQIPRTVALLIGLLLLFSAVTVRGQENGIPGAPAAGELVLTPDTLDFGRVCVGTCALDTIVITNVSSFAIRIDSIQPWNPYLSDKLIVPQLDERLIGAGDTVQLVVRFCPTDTGYYFSWYDLVPRPGGSTLGWFRFGMFGRSVRSDLRTLDAVEFPSTPLDTCRDTTFYVRNARSADIDSARICLLQLLNGTTGFGIGSYRPDSLIAGGDSTAITLRFCPQTLGDAEDTLQINDRNFIPLRGRGLPKLPVLKQHRLLLDTAAAAVGDPVRLRMRLDPPLDTDEKLIEYRIELTVDPAALYAQSVTGPSTGMTLTRGPNGNLVVERPANLPSLNDDLLFELNLMGLSTGQALNRVVIGTATLPGIAVAGRENGLVELTGCDLGRDFAFLRRTAFRSVAYDPISTNVSTRCARTPGLSAILSMYDMNGSVVGTAELSPDGHEEQTATIPCGLLAPGIYVLRLNDGVDVTTAPVFITR